MGSCPGPECFLSTSFIADMVITAVMTAAAADLAMPLAAAHDSIHDSSSPDSSSHDSSNSCAALQIKHAKALKKGHQHIISTETTDRELFKKAGRYTTVALLLASLAVWQHH